MARDFKNRAFENVGIDQRIWIVAETGGYGKLATGGLFPVATDAIEHTDAKITFNIPRDDAAHRSGRSLVVRLSKKKDAKFTFESYIVPADPSGSDPVLPDMHSFLVSAIGSVDTTDPAVIKYKLTKSTTTSIRMLEEGTHFSRVIFGCVTDNATFTLPGDGKAMFKCDGFAQDVVTAGQSTLSAPVAAANVLVVQTGEGARYDVGAYVDVIDAATGNTRLAAARMITAISGDSLTVAGAAITAATDDIVVGAAPDYTATSSANALLGLRGQFTTGLMGTVDAQLISAEIGIKNNYTQKNFVYGSAETLGFIADKRRAVSIKLDVLLTRDNFEFYQNNTKFIADNLQITLEPQDIPAPSFATTAGRTFTFIFPKVEFNVPALEQPSDGYVKLTLTGVALASDINSVNNELELHIS